MSIKISWQSWMGASIRVNDWERERERTEGLFSDRIFEQAFLLKRHGLAFNTQDLMSFIWKSHNTQS